MARDFMPYDLDQHYLLPPDMREWPAAGHPAWFVSDVADSLDLFAVMRAYEKRELRGCPGYHPALMVKLLLYAYCVGKPSSRKIEKATFEEVPFRVLAAGQHPDHASIAVFRRRHLAGLSAGARALPPREPRAARARGPRRNQGARQRLAPQGHELRAHVRRRRAATAEVAEPLREAERVDAQEDRLYGNERRGDELPE